MIGRRLAAMALGAAACSAPTDPERRVASVQVSPDLASLWVADTLQLSVTLRDQAGLPIAGPDVTWTSSDTVVASVDTGGKVIALAAGVVTITASSQSESGRTTIAVSALSLLVEGYVGGVPEVFRVPIDGGAPQRLLMPGTVASDVTQATLFSVPEAFSVRPDGTDPRKHTDGIRWGPALHPAWLREH